MISRNPRRFQYDFAVYDGQSRLSAVVEVKSRLGADDRWAQRWRDLMLERTGAPINVPTFLVLPEHIYRWEAGAPQDTAPSAAINAAPLLGPYFKRLDIDISEVHPETFETIVGMWLDDYARGDRSQADDAQESLAPLIGGEVVPGVAA